MDEIERQITDVRVRLTSEEVGKARDYLLKDGVIGVEDLENFLDELPSLISEFHSLHEELDKHFKKAQEIAKATTDLHNLIFKDQFWRNNSPMNHRYILQYLPDTCRNKIPNFPVTDYLAALSEMFRRHPFEDEVMNDHEGYAARKEATSEVSFDDISGNIDDWGFIDNATTVINVGKLKLREFYIVEIKKRLLKLDQGLQDKQPNKVIIPLYWALTNESITTSQVSKILSKERMGMATRSYERWK